MLLGVGGNASRAVGTRPDRGSLPPAKGHILMSCVTQIMYGVLPVIATV